MAGMEDNRDLLGSTTVLPTDVLEEFATAEQRLQVGTVLRDRFMLMEEVAGGSMGTVYKAMDRRLAEADADDHWVAIKVLKPQLADNNDALRALQQEAVKTRCLSHPNIVRFIDLDREDDLYFMVMEWLEGRSLYELINESAGKNVDLATAFDITRQVGAALDYAHQRGIVHADVKPSNIMMMPSGQVKLFDFGVARIRQKQHTRQHEFDPTILNPAAPAYSSMQVLTGEDPAPADDVFSLACLAYRLIAGYRVFGPRDAAQAAEEGMEPQPIESLSKTQWQALKKALAFSRVTRYSTPADFVAAFTASTASPASTASTAPTAPTASTAPTTSTEPTASTENSVDPGRPVMSAHRYDADEFDGENTVDVMFGLPSRSQWWLVVLVLVFASVGAFLWQYDLSGLVESYMTVGDRAPIEQGTVARPIAAASGEMADNVVAATAAQKRPIETEPAVNGQATSPVESIGTRKPELDEPAKELTSEPAAASNDLQVVETPALPAADISVALAELGALPDTYSLTLIEDSEPAIVDFVRGSNLGESLTFSLVPASDGSSKSPWEAGQFSISNNGLIVFPAGEHRARVTIAMESDSLREPDRETTLVVRGADYAGSEFAIVNLTLQDDDQRSFEDSLGSNTVAFSVSQVSVRERDPAVQIDVIRFKPDGSRMAVDYVISDVTATAGEDYIAPGSGTVLFGPGQRLARILIPVVQDTSRESDEAFMLELIGNVGGTESNIYRRIAVMIRDDDS